MAQSKESKSPLDAPLPSLEPADAPNGDALFEAHFRHNAPITSLSITQDGKHLIAVGGDAVSIFSLETGKLLRRTSPETHGDIHAAAPSPDGASLLLSTTNKPNNQVRVLSLDTFKIEKTLSPQMMMALSPDGHSLLAFGRRQLVIYKTNDGKQICELEKSRSYGNHPRRAAFSPDGESVMTAPRGFHQTKANWPIFLWSTKTGKIEKTLKGTGTAVCDVAFTRAGVPVSVDRNGVVGLHDKATGKPIWTFYTGSWAAYEKPIYDIDQEHRVAASPDGKWIAVSIDECLIYLLDAKTGERVWTTRRAYIHKISAIVFSPDSQQLFVSDGARIRSFSVADSAEQTPPSGCLGPISRVIESDEDEVVAIGEKDAYLWRVSTHEAKQIIRDDEAPSITRSPFDVPSFTIISGDGGTIAELDSREGGDIFSAKTGAFLCRIPLAANDQIHSAALSFDGKYLALTMTRGSNLHPHSEKDPARLSLFSIETGCFTTHLAEGKILSALQNPAFSPDGRFVACINKTQILLFDCQGKKPLSVLCDSLGIIRSGCFSQDSRSLFGLSNSRLLTEWSLPEAKIIRRQFILETPPSRAMSGIDWSLCDVHICDVHNGVAAIKAERATCLVHLKDNSIEMLNAESTITAITFSERVNKFETVDIRNLCGDRGAELVT